MVLPLLSDTPMMADAPEMPTADQMEFVSGYAPTINAIGETSLAEHAAFILPASAVALATTLIDSVIPGDQDAAIQNMLSGTVFGDYFTQNRSLVGAIGDTVGLFVPATLGAKAIRTAGFVGKAAEKTLGPKLSRWVTSTGQSNDVLFESTYQRARIMGQANVKDLNAVPGFLAERRSKLIRSTGDVVVESAAAEIAIAMSMNQSDFLFPDEMTFADNLAWFAGTTGIVGAGASLIARRTMQKGVQTALDAGRVKAFTPAEMMLTDAVGNLTNARGVKMAVVSERMVEEKTALTASLENGDTLRADTATKMQTALNVEHAALVRNMFRDRPFPEFAGTESWTPAFGKEGEIEPYIRTMRAASEANPHLTIGALSLDRFQPDQAINFIPDMSLKINQNKQAIVDLTNELDEMRRKTSTKQRRAGIQRRENQLKDLIDRTLRMERTVPLVVEIDGQHRGLKNRAHIFQDGDRNIASWQNGMSSALVGDRHIVSRADGVVEFVQQKKNLTLEIDEAGELVSGGNMQQLDNKLWATLSHEDRTAIFDTMQHAFERIDPATWKGMVVGRNAHWTQHDFALRILNSEKGKDPRIASKIQIEGARTKDDILARSLAGKYEAFKSLRKDALTRLREGESIYNDFDNIARALNLPGDRNPVLLMFEKLHGMTDGKGKLSTVTQNNLGMFKNLIRQHADLPPDAPIADDLLYGAMLQMPRDHKPILMLSENLQNRAGLQAADLAVMVAEQRGIVVERLRQSAGAVDQQGRPMNPVLGATFSVIESMQHIVQEAKRHLPFLVHGNLVGGAIADTFASQRMRFRENAAFEAFDTITRESELAASKLTERLMKAGDPRTGERIEAFLPRVEVNERGAKNARSYSEVFSDLQRTENRADLSSALMARHSMGAGWHIDEALPFHVVGDTQGGQKMYKIPLKNSEHNRALWEAMFPDRPWPFLTKGTKQVFMPVTRRSEHVVVSDKARVALMAMNELDEMRFNQEAALLTAVGRTPPAKRAMHLPAKNLSKKFRSYLVNKAGHVVSVVAEDTERALKDRVQKNIALSKGEFREVPEDTIRQFYDSYGLSFDAMDDFSQLANQTGSPTGKSFDDIMELAPAVWQGMTEQILRGFSDIGRKTRMLLFEPELRYASLMRDATGLTKAGEKSRRSVYDELYTRIAGTQNLDKNSAVGKVLTVAESLYDNNLKAAWANTIGAAFSKPLFSDLNQAARWEALDKEFGAKHLPFKTFEEFAERTMDASMPWTLRRHAALLNEATTALTIRMFDAGMAVVNVVSLAATLPPVVAMLRQMPDETHEQWARRIGAFAGVTDVDKAYFSPAKAIVDAIHFSFSDEGRRIAGMARKMGYMDQLAAEAVELYGKTGEDFISSMTRKAVDKVSILTDSTERLSRSMAWMTFYNVGRKGLGLEERAAMAFAHQQANNTIADFRPANRPQIFQGAAGMPLGLFTTYMWNYTERLVRLVETASFNPLKKGQRQGLLQVGLQSSLFGAESLPGWDLYTEHFMTNYDGTTSPVDRLNDAFGYVGADVFLNGTVSNLPRLFGSGLEALTGSDLGLNDGISIGPRASVGLPFESGVSAQSIAGVRLMQRVAGTISKSMNAALEDFDPMQQAEILASSGINKGISHAIELFVTGKSLDYSGSIIEADTRTTMGVISRLSGFKPLATDEMRVENVRNRTTDRIHNELKERLADNLKSKIRNGRLSGEDVEDALDSYIKAGGSPGAFKRFFESQVMRGTQTKNRQEQEIALRLAQSIDQNRLGRLLYLSRD